MRLDSLAPSPEPSPSPEPNPSSGPCSPSEQAAAIEGLAFEDEAGHHPETAIDGAAAGVLSREQFAAGLRMAFQLSGGLVGFTTLRAAPEQPTFGPAADALYDTAREVPWLSWLISPDSIWLQRAIAVGAFAVPVAAGCAAELRARRIRPAKPSAEDQSPKAAENGDSQPVDG